MSTLQDHVAAVSSVTFRISAYVFLRWILPPILYTLFAIYLLSFISSFFTQSQYDIVGDEVDVTITGVEVEDSPPVGPSAAASLPNPRSHEKHIHIEEEVKVKVKETVLLQERSPELLRTILTGLPSPTSALLSIITLLLNVGLLLAATDFIYRGKVLYPSDNLSFARIGYVSDVEARLLVREPDVSKYPIFVSMKTNELNGWQSMGGISFPSNETDHTTVFTIPLRALDPRRPGEQKVYHWVTSNNHSGTFIPAPKPGASSMQSNGKFTFLTSSCILPHFPYNPFDHPLSIPGFRHLGNLLPSLSAQFMLFLGDFIYIDVPKRFGTGTEDYRREYRQVYASPDWPSVSQNLSWIHVLDDHELADNWDNGTSGIYDTAVGPWNQYQAAVNPPLARKASKFAGARTTPTYFEFTHGPASFFMLDTRRYRDRTASLPANDTEKTMLGAQQLADFLDWLERPVPKGVKWKIVASSVPFTKNWPINRMDTWGGYLSERQKILTAMWDVGLKGGVGVVVLSGDRHEFAAVTFPPPADSKWPVSAAVHEFSTSPLNQFYSPFPSYRETDDDDVLVKYITKGNSKFGVVTIESPETSDQSILTFQLFIDGKQAWSSVILSPPKVSGKGWARKDSLWG